MTKRIMKPMININGETRYSHVTKRMNFCNQLRDLIQTHNNLAPHPRDYPIDNNQFIVDWNLHSDRFSILYDLLVEVNAEAENISFGEEE